MMKRIKTFLLSIIVLASIFFLSSCELFYTQQEPGKVYLINIGIRYGTKDINGNTILGTQLLDGSYVSALTYTFSDSEFFADCISELCARAGRELVQFEFSDFNRSGARLSASSANFPSVVNVEAKIREFSNMASENDTLIFFCSSHGYSENFAYKTTPLQSEVQYSETAQYQAQSGIGLESFNVHFIIDYWPASDLYNVMKLFPGKKCIFGDFCFSGSVIAENNITTDATTYSTSNNSIDVFSDLLFSDSKIQQESDFYILSASKTYEQSYEFGTLGHGLFTYGVLDALGYDTDSQSLGSEIPASFLGKVSLQQVADKAQEAIETTGLASYQHMKITGTSDDLILFDFN
jgi:hypothetical protein